MRTLKEIDARMVELRGMVSMDDANLDEIQTELDALIEERKTVVNANEKRQQMLDKIAGGMGVQVENPFKNEQEETEERSVLDTKEYRSAFFHAMMGKPLNAAEQRAMDEAVEKRALTSASSSAGAALPTQTQDEVFRKLKSIAPMLEEITLFSVPGNMSLVVEAASVADAAAHTEGADTTEAGDKLVSVNLTGFEVIKVLSISAKVRVMSIGAFEAWLVDALTDGIANKLEDWIINGTGSNQPTGVAKARTWTDASTAIKFAAAAPTKDELFKMIGLLPAAYDRNAKFLMNKKTLWQNVMPIRDDSKLPLVKEDGQGGFVIMGYPVKLSDKTADGEIYFGDYKRYVGNMAEDIAVEASAQSSFRKNLVDYRGTCIFDGKPAVEEAFIKGAAAL